MPLSPLCHLSPHSTPQGMAEASRYQQSLKGPVCRACHLQLSLCLSLKDTGTGGLFLTQIFSLGYQSCLQNVYINKNLCSLENEICVL